MEIMWNFDREQSGTNEKLILKCFEAFTMSLLIELFYKDIGTTNIYIEIFAKVEEKIKYFQVLCDCVGLVTTDALVLTM